MLPAHGLECAAYGRRIGIGDRHDQVQMPTFCPARRPDPSLLAAGDPRRIGSRVLRHVGGRGGSARGA